MAALLGDEAEADQAFWGQNAWNEEESEVDQDFDSTESEVDDVDTDFDESEGEEDDGKQAEGDVKTAERSLKRKAVATTSGYKEPTIKRANHGHKVKVKVTSTVCTSS